MSVSVIGVDYDNQDGVAKSLAETFKAHRENGDQLINLSEAAKNRAAGDTSGPKKDAARPPYVFQPFPQHVYHADGRDKVVATPAQLRAAKEAGYRETPYPKARVAVGDPGAEKAALQQKLADSEGKIAVLNEAQAKLAAQVAELVKNAGKPPKE